MMHLGGVVAANVFGEHEVSDFALALLLAHDGYPVVKCMSDGWNANTIWVFKDIPECDFAIYQEEVLKPETTVKLLPLLSALQTLQAAQKAAARNCGVWTGNWYAKRNR